MKGRSYLVAAIWLSSGAGTTAAAQLADLRQLAVEGRYEEALEAVDEALAIQPRSAELELMRGFVLARAGREDEALQVFLELTREHPEYPEPFNNLAVIYARRGDYERAAEVLEQALRTHSSYRTAYENLAKVNGQLDARAYDRALGQESDAPDVGSSLHLLSDLRGAAPDAGAGDSGVPALEPMESAAARPAPPAFDAAVVVDVVRRWARAWSEQRADDYLGFYASGFAPTDGSPRSRWAAQRRRLIQDAGSIDVEVESVGVRPLEGGRAQVRFVQTYRSDGYRDRVIKTLDMAREGGEWKIVREASRPE